MRDPNGQIFWSFATEGDLLPAPVPELAWNGTRHCLTLSPSAPAPMPAGNRVSARNRAAQPAMAVDAFGTFARVNAAGSVEAGGAADLPETIFTPPAGFRVLDLTWTVEGHLLLALRDAANTAGPVVWLDRLARFDPVVLSEPGFLPDRLCASPAGGPVWAVDRAQTLIRVVRGTPIPDVLDTLSRSPSVFAPRPEMADPPRLERPRRHRSAGREIIDACADETGDLLLLRLPPGAQAGAVLQRIAPDGTTAVSDLQGAVLPFTMALVSPGVVAVAVLGWTEARAYRVPDLVAPVRLQLPLGARFPLRGWTGARFCSGAVLRGSYPTATDPFRPLAPLSLAAFADQGETRLALIDAGVEGFVWHRLCLEAALAEGCRLTVLAAAADRADALEGAGAAPAWQPHHLLLPGDAAAAHEAGEPVAVWLDAASERPFLGSALDAPRQRDRAGLFTVLLQKARAGGDSRIAGRFLALRLQFSGNRRASPRLHALRAWGPRFSYRDRYLPELYRVGDGPGAAGSDFLDRYLALFESFLTPMEDEVAHCWRLARPETVPEDSLDWLAGWLGVFPDGALGPSGKRRLIRAAARLAPWRGTLRGLSGMLDIATDGGIADGRIVVVEHFRMQRTFATILGADFSDRLDPLTRGSNRGGNSYLGPAFFLGAENEKRLFALFRPELLDHPLTTPEERALALAQMQTMFTDAAFRLTVLVHDETDPERRALIARVVQRETPAHVVAEIHDAPASLILGLSALLGVETRSGRAPEIPPITLGQTAIGQGRLRGIPALDQRI